MRPRRWSRPTPAPGRYALRSARRLSSSQRCGVYVGSFDIGSGPALHQRPGTTYHAPRDPGAGSARARPADRPGAGVNGRQGPCGPGGGADLRPRPGVMRSGRRDASALPNAAGFMSVLSISEAVQHFTRGLELLTTLPETPARAQQELDLQIALGPVLMAAKGHAAPEVEQTYARARALCAQVGETPQLFPTLRGLCRFYRYRKRSSTSPEAWNYLPRSPRPRRGLSKSSTCRSPWGRC